MQKTSVYLPKEFNRELDRIARSEGVSRAEVIRRAIEREIRDAPRPRFTAIGVGRGPGDVVARMDEYLAEGFGRD